VSVIPKKLEAKLRAQAKNRCGYCLVPQKLVSYRLEIEHIFPIAKGGTDEEENLWLACRQCNLTKATKTHGFDPLSFVRVKLFNPREEIWHDHFAWSSGKTEVIGKTSCGRATVSALQLNGDLHRIARGFLKSTGIFPPNE
jgi:HNH endonuclease